MASFGSLTFAQYQQHIASLVTETDRLLNGVEPADPVPGCPDWVAADLRDHCAGVLAFWAHQLRLADASATGPSFDDDVRERYRLPLATLGPELIAELSAAGPDRDCWNWSGANLHAGWPARRMAQEFAVHCTDAQATAGLDRVIDGELAADGIDELIEVFLAPSPGEQVDPVGVLRVSGVNPTRRWLIDVGSGGVVASAEDAAATATLSGQTDQLLLDLWGRQTPAVETTGDPAALSMWRELAHFE